jgi:hypothetical protein
MNRNWDDAAADTFTYLHQGKRAFPAKKMLSMLDDLAVQGSVTQAYLMEKHGSDNFIATTLSNITTAIHGKGSVPKRDGWYATSVGPYVYTIDEGFAEAWRRQRGLSRDSNG